MRTNKLFKVYPYLFLFSILLSGCQETTDQGGNTPQNTNTSSNTGSQEVVIRHPDLWAAFLAYKDKISNAESMDEILPLMDTHARELYESSDPSVQEFMFLITQNMLAGVAEYRASYSMIDSGAVYVADDDPDLGRVIHQVEFSLENDGWMVSGVSINTDTVVEELYSEEIVSAIQSSVIGKISYEDMSMPIEYALGFSNKEENELTIVLLPYQLTSEQLLSYRTGNLGGPPDDAPLVNEALWPNWSPFVLFTIHFENIDYGFSKQNITNVCFSFNWFDDKTSFYFSCYEGYEDVLSVTSNSSTTPKSVVISTAGTSLESSIQWSLSGEFPVFNEKIIDLDINAGEDMFWIK